jgi:hypothetical protein
LAEQFWGKEFQKIQEECLDELFEQLVVVDLFGHGDWWLNNCFDFISTYKLCRGVAQTCTGGDTC